MGISFIGLGVSLAIIVILAVIIYFCCCRKDKQSGPNVVTHGQNISSQPPGPGYPTGLPDPSYPPAPVGGGAIGWNVDQTTSGVGAAPYPRDNGALGSGWGSDRPTAPPPSYAPPPYPQ
ncbi:unnamed protein product [Mesocestoides corti]|uniref:Uncharacterized protein n=1 Tax=Mesocestoides corti TaxID=53468 RepID=A0A0R3U5G5_MESCO|nr:unnamed protein product [Mesocestoides corti]